MSLVVSMGQQENMHEDDRASEKVILGRITGVYGVKGWVKVFSYTDPMEAIVDYSPWYVRAQPTIKSAQKPDQKNRAPWTKVKLKAGKRHAKTVVAKLEGCNNRDEAMFYIGTEVAIEKQQLEELKHKDEYYWSDLIGLQVINQQGVELGIVKSLMETGANDVLVVVSEEQATESDGSKVIITERLIPWTMDNAIIAVDLEQKIIEVDWDADF